MTNLEALRAKLNYPLPDNSFIVALTDRGLTYTDDYSDQQSLELAQADLIYTLITTPNTTEGGYAIVINDKKSLLLVAENIYKKYGVRNPLRPTAKFVQKW